MATVWLAPKQEYVYAIANMDLRWDGETVSVEERDESLSQLDKMVCYISDENRWTIVQPGWWGGVSGQDIQKYQPWDNQGHYCSNSLSGLCHARDYNLGQSSAHIFLRRNDIDKYIMDFDDTCRGYKRLFSSPVNLFYTRHTSHFLTVWKLLLPLVYTTLSEDIGIMWQQYCRLR